MAATRILRAMFVEAASANATRLPEALEARAVVRLRWLVLGSAIAFLSGIPLRWLSWRVEDETLFLISSVVSAVLAVVGGIVYAALTWGRLPHERALWVGLGYEVALCFSLAFVEQVIVGFAPLPFRLSSVALVLIVFPLVVPSPPRLRLITTVAAAVAQPVALGVVALAASGRFDLRSIVAASAPTFLVAGVSAWLGQVVHRMRIDADRAMAFGQYELVERLGQGGMGEVWRAKHAKLMRPAAIKLIRPDEADVHGKSARARFHREAQATAALTSPHTVSLFDYGTTEEGTLFYAMELLQGVDLESLVKHVGALPAERVLHVLDQTCLSLEEAHELGLVHRDIKPANIVLCRVGTEVDFVKVLDFGLVKPRYLAEGSQVSVAGAVSGTPGYVAPEHAAGKPIDGRSDLYSLGCVAYYLLTGQRVFVRRTKMELLTAHLMEDPTPPSQRAPHLSIPPAVDALVMQLLSRDPKERPRDAHELRARVRAARRDLPTWSRERAFDWWQEHLPELAKAKTQLRL
ncbi:MAG: serine/threonine protein kinase [Myxococcales bacterium]|nr:serine/threonine protein kinase [Myxococcales bacterium]